ncbi:MAG: hypothetical protein ACLP8S_02655 [Solirubrobacteraceae bacterium]
MSLPSSIWLNQALLSATVEIAQAARHDAKHLLDRCQHDLVLADRFLDLEIDQKRAREAIADAADALRDLYSTLDRMALSRTRDLQQTGRVNLARAFEDAAELVGGWRERLSARYDASDANIDIETVPYVIQMVFVELLLTTLSGYSLRRSDSNRMIRLSCVPDSEPNQYRLRYLDSGARFHAKYVEAFARAVESPTSEPSSVDDPVWRLFLAQRLLASIGATLSVLPSSVGASFEIVIPAYQNDPSSST